MMQPTLGFISKAAASVLLPDQTRYSVPASMLCSRRALYNTQNLLPSSCTVNYYYQVRVCWLEPVNGTSRAAARFNVREKLQEHFWLSTKLSITSPAFTRCIRWSMLRSSSPAVQKQKRLYNVRPAWAVKTQIICYHTLQAIANTTH